MPLIERNYRLSYDKGSGTTLYFVTDFGKQTITPTIFQPEIAEVAHWGVYDTNFNFDSILQYRFDKDGQFVIRWEPNRPDAKTMARCALLRAKCSSMHLLHRRVVVRRLDATKLMTQDQIYERKTEEAARFLKSKTKKNMADFPYLMMASHYLGRDDYFAIAEHIMVKHREYETVMLQTEDHRMAWTKAIREAETIADVQKIGERLQATTYLGKAA